MYLTDEEFKELVVEEFNFVSGNVGTNYAPVLLKSKYDVCKELDDIAVALKNHYKALFFNDKIQTYTFVYLYLVLIFLMFFLLFLLIHHNYIF